MPAVSHNIDTAAPRASHTTARRAVPTTRSAPRRRPPCFHGPGVWKFQQARIAPLLPNRLTGNAAASSQPQLQPWTLSSAHDSSEAQLHSSGHPSPSVQQQYIELQVFLLSPFMDSCLLMTRVSRIESSWVKLVLWLRVSCQMHARTIAFVHVSSY
jgi:hypothetical protein